MTEQTEAPHFKLDLQPLGPASVSLALLISALWGGTPVAISYSLDTLPPVAVAGIRFALAAGFMLFWCWWEGSKLALQKGQLLPILITGTFLFVQISLFNLGVQYSNSSHGSLFINTFIFWVAGIEHFITKSDRLSLAKIVGLLLAALGVVLILTSPGRWSTDAIPASGQDQPTLLGDLIVLSSAFLFGVKLIYTQKALKRIEPGKLIFWHDVVGVVLFFTWSLIFEEVTLGNFTPTAIWALLYQGVAVAGFCFAVQAFLLRKHPASKVAVFNFTTPLFGIALGVLFRGDNLSPWLFVSGICVAIGILLVNMSHHQPENENSPV